jgi:TonB family protein
MSTANFPYDGGYEGYRPLTLFGLASLLLHAGFLWLVMSSGGALQLFTGYQLPPDREPIYVDVIELPPGVSILEGPQKEIKRYADRTNVVEKETIPERTPRAILIPGGPKTSGSEGKIKGTEAGVKTEALKTAKAPPGSTDIPPDIPNDIPDREGVSIDKEGVSIETPVLKGTGAAGVKTIEGKTAEKTAPSSKSGTPGSPYPGSRAETGRPNLFLTEEKLSELAEKYEKEAPTGEKGKTLQLNTTELRYQKYLIDMKHRIEFYWEYPILAIRNGWQGKLLLDFTIKNDGTIEEIKLVKSSGYPVLDDSARTALKLAAPFPPFPEHFGIEQINIKGQFEYNLIDVPPPPLR